MNASQAEILRQLLIDLGLGVVGTYTANIYTGAPWPVFATNEPDKPDSAITVYDTSGMVDSRDHEGDINEHLGFQVRLRSAKQADGRQKADATRLLLSGGVLNEVVTVDNHQYLVGCIAKFGPRLALGTEPGTNRSIFTINATAVIRQLN